MYTEDDWNETSSLSRNPYYYSKKLAEKAAWDWMKENDPPFQMVVINPFAVLGASLDNRMNTSFGIISTIANGELKWGMCMRYIHANERSMDGPRGNLMHSVTQGASFLTCAGLICLM